MDQNDISSEFKVYIIGKTFWPKNVLFFPVGSIWSKLHYIMVDMMPFSRIFHKNLKNFN